MMARMVTTTEPTFRIVPDGDERTGQDCVDVAHGYGIPLDDWQADIVRGVLRESSGGWSASQAGLVLSRQSGKSQILTALTLFGLYELNEQVLATSHQVKTSSDAFRRLWSVIQSHDDLARRVRRHSQMIGGEYLELSSGARAMFTTRSASAGRGLSVDRLLIDECEDFPAAEAGALLPTLFARPKPGYTDPVDVRCELKRRNALSWWENEISLRSHSVTTKGIS